MSDSLSSNAQAALDKVVSQFQSGDLGTLVEVIMLRHKGNIPFMRWTLSNQLLAYVQTMGSTDCRTFNQWKEVGRSVRKGEKAAYILGPVTKKVADKVTGEDKIIVIGFRGIAVFAVEQTDGDELGTEIEEEFAPLALPPLMDVAESLGVSVRYWPTVEQGARGWYNPGKMEIVLGTQEWKTFFHELAHAAHDALAKANGGKLVGGQDVDQEVIAEFTAAVLGQLYGLDYSGNAWQYIKGYAGDPLKAVVRCLSTVEKVLEIIMGTEEKELVLA